MAHRSPLPLAVVATALLAVAAPAVAQRARAEPPPPRTFGPDQTATGVFTGEGLTPPGLSCDSPADPATPITCSGFLASAVDGTLLETTVRVPRTAGPHPLVVGMHGWGGTGASMGRYDARLTSAGYAFLRYSARGFGGSWGQANLADVDVEGADLRSLIAQTVDDPRIAADAGAVAVFGASYGGAHAWLGALVPEFTSPAGNPVRIRTVVPVASWTDLLSSLLPNGRPEGAQDVTGFEKLSFVEALLVGGLRTRLDRPYPNYPAYLLEWDAVMTGNEAPFATNPLAQGVVDGLQGYRSAYWQEAFWERVRANAASGAPQLPVFAVQGFTDDLFPAGEALRMADALRAVDPSYPIALYLGDLGHPRATNKSGEVAYVLDAVVSWLDFFLQGKGAEPAYDVQAAITRPAATPFDPADVIRAPTYAALATRVVTRTFRAPRLVTFDPANVTGFRWDPLVVAGCGQLDPCPTPPDSEVVPGDVAAYTVPVAALNGGAPVLLAGEPTVTLRLLTPAHRVQLDVRLFDVAPGGAKSLVTRGTYTVDTGSPARPIALASVRVPTYGNLWALAADHRLRLEITNVDSPYLRPSLIPSLSLVAGVELALPVR